MSYKTKYIWFVNRYKLKTKQKIYFFLSGTPLYPLPLFFAASLRNLILIHQFNNNSCLITISVVNFYYYPFKCMYSMPRIWISISLLRFLCKIRCLFSQINANLYVNSTDYPNRILKNRWSYPLTHFWLFPSISYYKIVGPIDVRLGGYLNPFINRVNPSQYWYLGV